jgi:hypothetical protein
MADLRATINGKLRMTLLRKHLFVACATFSISCGCHSGQAPTAESSAKVLTEPRYKMPPADGISDGLVRGSKPATLCNVELIGTITAPLASADAMKKILVYSTKATPIVGWAVDSDTKVLASGVELAIDGHPYKAKYGNSRPDVSIAFKNSAYTNSGYSFSLPADCLAPGTHSLEIRVLSHDAKGYSALGPFDFRVE